MTALSAPVEVATSKAGTAKSADGGPNSFLWSDLPEPHAARKAAVRGEVGVSCGQSRKHRKPESHFHPCQILKAHPEISSLMGPCPWTKYQVLSVVVLQVRGISLVRGHARDWTVPVCLTDLSCCICSEPVMASAHPARVVGRRDCKLKPPARDARDCAQPRV